MLDILAHIVVSLALAVGGKRALLYLQMGYYKPKRGFVKLFLTKYYLLLTLVGVASFVLWIFAIDYHLVNIFLVLLVAIIELLSKTKPTLKVTNRIKRLFCALFLLLCVAYHVPLWARLFSLPLFTLGAFYLTLPFENINNARYVRRAKATLETAKATKIAIVGSFGKTSVKNILYALLSTSHTVAMPPQNYNTPLGVAKFVNRGLPQTDFIIFELGAAQRGDIAALCDLIKPDCAVFTGCGSCHLSTFGNMENLVATKRELLAALSEKAFCVLNADNPTAYSSRYLGKCRYLLAGERGVDVILSNVRLTSGGSTFCLTFDGETRQYFTRLLGRQNALNIAMCVSLARQFEMNVDLLTSAIASLEQCPHRMQLITNGEIDIIDDSYNANIEGVEALVEVLKQFEGDVYVISQGIVELGRGQATENYLVGTLLAEVATAVCVLGGNASQIAAGLRQSGYDMYSIFYPQTLMEGVDILRRRMRQGDVLVFQNDLPDIY